MGSSGLSWLCNFLQHNINVNDDLHTASEKHLLTTLSTVCRHFRHIQIEGDSLGSCGRNCLTDDMHNFTFRGHRQGDDMRAHNCMTVVSESLAAFLVLENDFISHSARKTLYILSCHLMESVSEWKDFVDKLWICLKAICFDIDTQPIMDTRSQQSSYTIDQRSSTSIAIDTKEVQCCDSSSNKNCLKKRFIGASRLIQLLRSILKACFLKTEKLVDIYLHITEKYIVGVAWFLLNKISLDDGFSPARSSYESFPVSSSTQWYCFEEKELVLGSLLQFLCSLVHVVSAKFRGGGDVVIQCPLLTRVNDLLPALSVQALSLHNHPGDTCISDFLRHKYLILMSRLSECFLKNPSFIVTWLELLGEHAADLLCHPLPENRIHGSSLLGSPFWTSSINCKGEFDICKSHLQSRAVFLLFKFSCILIREDLETPKGTGSFHCPLLEKLISIPQVTPLGESGHEKAFTNLINWLWRQMFFLSASTGDVSVNTRKTFTSSFLRLFMDEDDLMFEMLLQLLDMHLLLQQGQHKGNSVLDDKQCMDTCLLILESLKPDSLLYEFLAAIEYDESVIVDYLISKTTGTLCLRYLLRCLRILSDVWPTSAGSATDISDPCHFDCKREQHQLDLKETLETKLSVVSDASEITEASNDGCELEENLHKRKRDGLFLPLSMIDVDSSGFQRAKGCLSSLHFHIESLHRKDLFPYNPSPLLKRLEKFLLLCNDSQ